MKEEFAFAELALRKSKSSFFYQSFDSCQKWQAEQARLQLRVSCWL